MVRISGSSYTLHNILYIIIYVNVVWLKGLSYISGLTSAQTRDLAQTSMRWFWNGARFGAIRFLNRPASKLRRNGAIGTDYYSYVLVGRVTTSND